MRSILALASLLSLAVAAPAATTFTCPAGGTLPPNYVKTSLIVEVSKKLPNTVFGATTFPLITPGDFAAVINLALPASAYNKICRLVFLFPDHYQTVNPFIYVGPGTFNFTGYAVGDPGKADPKKTTYNNQPAPGPSPPQPGPIKPGNAYTIFQAPCGFPPGLPGPVTVGGLLSSPDTYLAFYESDLKCPLGIFVELLDAA